MKIDKAKANAAIDAYLAELADPDRTWANVSSLYVAKARLENYEVIPDARKLDLDDHCALWVAVIRICRRVGEVDRAERAKLLRGNVFRYRRRSLKRTIREWETDPIRLTPVRRYRQHLADNGFKPRLKV